MVYCPPPPPRTPLPPTTIGPPILVKFNALWHRVDVLYVNAFRIIVGQVLGHAEDHYGGPLGSVPKQPGRAGLSGGFQMRAGPGLQAFPAGLAAFLGGLSLNRIFSLKDSLLPILRKSPKYET